MTVSPTANVAGLIVQAAEEFWVLNRKSCRACAAAVALSKSLPGWGSIDTESAASHCCLPATPTPTAHGVAFDAAAVPRCDGVEAGIDVRDKFLDQHRLHLHIHQCRCITARRVWANGKAFVQVIGAGSLCGPENGRPTSSCTCGGHALSSRPLASVSSAQLRHELQRRTMSTRRWAAP